VVRSAAALVYVCAFPLPGYPPRDNKKWSYHSTIQPFLLAVSSHTPSCQLSVITCCRDMSYFVLILSLWSSGLIGYAHLLH
jgi:hypothetical protein